MRKTKLKPCPFCGENLEQLSYNGETVYVHPDNLCVFWADYLKCKEDYTDWNRRSSRSTMTDWSDIEEFKKPVGDFKLDPCPFCGDTEVVYGRYKHADKTDRWLVACMGCLATIDPGWAQQKSVVRDMWNRRAGK